MLRINLAKEVYYNFIWLNLSKITATNKLRKKNAPSRINMMKYRDTQMLLSLIGALPLSVASMALYITAGQPTSDPTINSA